jgi:hypothetical protein
MKPVFVLVPHLESDVGRLELAGGVFIRTLAGRDLFGRYCSLFPTSNVNCSDWMYEHICTPQRPHQDRERFFRLRRHSERGQDFLLARLRLNGV